MNQMKKFQNFALSLLFLGIASLSAIERLDYMPHDHYSHLTLAGDIFSCSLPAVAVLKAAQEYHTGLRPLNKAINPVLSVAAMSATTTFFKRVFRHTDLGVRPNGYHDSFPSGHTSAAFCGAFLIHELYGVRYAVPAYALAMMTAYSRVDGHYHHPRDLVAGAFLAYGVHWIIYRSGYFSDTKNFLLKNDVKITPAANQGIRIEYCF
jgi:membrane-associated phospholipid phosphatase